MFVAIDTRNAKLVSYRCKRCAAHRAFTSLPLKAAFSTVHSKSLGTFGPRTEVTDRSLNQINSRRFNKTNHTPSLPNPETQQDNQSRQMQTEAEPLPSTMSEASLEPAEASAAELVAATDAAPGEGVAAAVADSGPLPDLCARDVRTCDFVRELPIARKPEAQPQIPKLPGNGLEFSAFLIRP